MQLSGEALRGYLDYLHDMGVYDLYRHGEPSADAELSAWLQSVAPRASATRPVAAATPAPSAATPAARLAAPALTPFAASRARAQGGPVISVVPPPPANVPVFIEDEEDAAFAPPSMPLASFNQLAPAAVSTAPADKATALAELRNFIGDCTRCPLAYAGRHTIVFADGDPNAKLMFVGEGPGADEDESGVPFVGKAGQLLNNMIGAMGLKRDEVYIANIVKCRPPKNRVPEPVEANTCSQFLLRQIDIVQPKMIVALGATAAMYLLGVKQPLSALRGQWHNVRGSKCAVTYHPAFLLRDPRQKGEAWKDLQRVMVELDLKPPARA